MSYLDAAHLRQIEAAAERRVADEEWRRRKPEWFVARREFLLLGWSSTAAAELADLHVASPGEAESGNRDSDEESKRRGGQW